MQQYFNQDKPNLPDGIGCMATGAGSAPFSLDILG